MLLCYKKEAVYCTCTVPATDRKIGLVVEIMMPKSEYDTVHEFIAYVEVEKTSA
jgi:hypothetical protein